MEKTGKGELMKIAIVEDDINMRKSLEIALKDYEEFTIVSYKNAKDALKKLDDSIDLVITDINMPGMDGIEFLRHLGGKYEAIVITGNATLNRAIESIRLGVKDFLTKPFEIETLVEAIKRSQRIRNMMASKNIAAQTAESENEFIASSPALQKALTLAEKAAMTDASVLILGESGVGKELFARHIHQNSPRKEAPFVALNMAAIPENLLESELFGYEKGAFTDATEGRAGKFEAANGGTIFLDEIGEMPMHLQAKILRVLQEKEVVRLGTSKPIKIDVRVISATNADIGMKIGLKEFREDLYYRLNTVPIAIPPLRERSDEILPLSQWVLEKTITRYGLESKQFSEATQKVLLDYRWPGNIRELISVCERAVILSEGENIQPEELFLEGRNAGRKQIANMEKELIEEVLQSCQGNLDEAGEMLGMEKSMLLKKCERHGIVIGTN